MRGAEETIRAVAEVLVVLLHLVGHALRVLAQLGQRHVRVDEVEPGEVEVGLQPTERVEKLLKTSGAWDEFKGTKAPAAAGAES